MGASRIPPDREADILKWAASGLSTRAISARLLKDCGVKASHEAVAKVLRRSREAPATAPPEQRLESARVMAQLDGAKELERIARIALRHAKSFKHTAPSTKLEVAMLGMLLREARGALMDRHELLHGKKKVVEVQPVNLDDPQALEALKREVFGGQRQGAADRPDVATGLFPPLSAPLDS
jgi:hypothetical protein